MLLSGGVSRVAKGADCKSAVLRLRRFESFFPHQYFQRVSLSISKPSRGGRRNTAATHDCLSLRPLKGVRWPGPTLITICPASGRRALEQWSGRPDQRPIQRGCALQLLSASNPRDIINRDIAFIRAAETSAVDAALMCRRFLAETARSAEAAHVSRQNVPRWPLWVFFTSCGFRPLNAFKATAFSRNALQGNGCSICAWSARLKTDIAATSVDIHFR
jgi:hypothetical protein